MYPPHLNYATRLPCKTLTIKNHNFHRGIFCLQRKFAKKVFFTDENNFFLLNIKMFGRLPRKKDGDKSRLVVERAKFGKHAMISAAVCAMAEKKTAFHSRQGKSKQ